MRAFNGSSSQKANTTSAAANKYIRSIATASSESYFHAEDEDIDSPLDSEDSWDTTNEPWKVLLSIPARAGWRATLDPQKSTMKKTIDAVLGETSYTTTEKSASKSLGKIIHNMKAIAKGREKDRRRLAGIFNSQEKRSLDAGKQLAAGGGGSKPVLYGPLETVANVKFRALPNFVVARRVLDEAFSLVGRHGKGAFRPKRVMDFGIGCGSASAAALEVFGDDSPIEWIHGVDASKTMRQAAERMLKAFVDESNASKASPESPTTDSDEESPTTDSDEEASITSSSGAAATAAQPAAPQPSTSTTPWAPRITLSAHLSSDPTMNAEELTSSMTRSVFDLCLFSYTATEIRQPSAILAAAALLWEKLKPGGLLVVIEPGTPDGSANVRSIRTMLLDCCPPNQQKKDQNTAATDAETSGAATAVPEEECHIIAPCTHNGNCPFARNDPTFKPPEYIEIDWPSTDSSGEKDEAEVDGGDGDNSSLLTAVDGTDHDSTNKHTEGAHQSVKSQSDEKKESRLLREAERFCSFVQTFPANHEEKFSYLVAQKRLSGTEYVHAAEEFDDVNISDMIVKQIGLDEDDPNKHRLNQEASDLAARCETMSHDHLGLELVRGQVQSFSRIIRAPRKRGRQVIIGACQEAGLVQVVIPKSRSKLVPGIYEAARKCRWGGFWPQGSQLIYDDDEPET